MDKKDLIIGGHYKTPSGAIFEFLKIDDSGDIVMKPIRDYMKIQSGITTFFWWFSFYLIEVEKVFIKQNLDEKI
jgi:hypothetical protein